MRLRREHVLLLEDRNRTAPSRDGGPTLHVHRWAAKCKCGWIGPFRRRRKEAKRAWATHLQSVQPSRRSGRRGRGGPRALTPVDDLPEQLRCARP